MPNQKLSAIYRKLYAYFGPQYWWPADSAFEVIVGAILTQNTAWRNVEQAISNLKKNNLLAADKLFRLPETRLAVLIRPAGYYNIKARRLKEFLKFFLKEYRGSVRKAPKLPLRLLRKQLLEVYGIGPETADSILLYALNKPSFVVDAYTKRIFSRHKLIPADASYDQARDFFMKNLKKKTKLFNEYHALIVRLGKEFCLKNKPRCQICPLRS